MATPNATTRKKQIEDMRAGKVLYQEDKDIVRGLISDLQSSEALIIIGTSNPEKINIRMGDVAFNCAKTTP
jgi:predicted oxidoreductase (fatty acid repression mutant protein)